MNASWMGFRTRTVLVVAAVALLAGCASDGSMLTSKTDGYRGSDADYIYAVEQTARRRGVRVVWINPPPETGKQYVSHFE